jgi:hypothetical protein
LPALPTPGGGLDSTSDASADVVESSAAAAVESSGRLTLNAPRTGRGPKLLAPPPLSLGERSTAAEPEEPAEPAPAADRQKLIWCFGAAVISGLALVFYRRRAYGEIRR